MNSMDTEYNAHSAEKASLSDSDMQARLKRFAPDVAYTILSETETVENLECRLNDLYESFLSSIVFLNMREGVRADAYRKLVIWRGGVLWHILLFKYDGQQRHISILNHYFKTCVQEVEAVRDILTGEYPRVRRITFPFVSLAEETVKRPRMTTGREHERGASDKVLELPESMDAYVKSLSANTRHKLRRYWKHITQDCPDVKVLLCEGADITPEQVRTIVEMSRTRMNMKGIERGYIDGLLHVLPRYVPLHGVLCALTVDGKIIGGIVNLVYRNTVYGVVISHDSAYNRYNAGNLVLVANVQVMIEKKLKHFHWMWGDPEYKERFGAREQCIWNVTVFRRSAGLATWLAWAAWRCRFTVGEIWKEVRWKLVKYSLLKKLYRHVRQLLRR